MLDVFLRGGTCESASLCWARLPAEGTEGWALNRGGPGLSPAPLLATYMIWGELPNFSVPQFLHQYSAAHASPHLKGSLQGVNQWTGAN